MYSLKKSALSIGLALAFGSSFALSTEIYIDVQTDYDGATSAIGADADSLTTPFTQLAVDFNSISTVTPTGDVAGLCTDCVLLDGDSFSDVGWGVFNDASGPNNFGADEFLFTDAFWPQLTFWFDDLQGEYRDDGLGNLLPTYSDGTLHIMFDDGLSFVNYNNTDYSYDDTCAALGDGVNCGYKDGTEILTITGLNGGLSTVGLGLVINGIVEIPAGVDGQEWWWTSAGMSFEDLVAGLMVINLRVDFNDEGFSQSDACEGFPTPVFGPCTFTRESDHNGSVQFQVPAPAPVALMGLGLLGLFGLRKGLRQRGKA